MQAVVAVTLPFFALVLCGYLAARQRVLPESAIPGLTAFVLFFALPCLLFRFGASQPIAQLVSPGLLAIYTASALLLVALALAVARAQRLDRRNAAFGALVAAFPNTGFMGVPLLVALVGDAAAGPMIVTLLVDLVLTSSLCLALAEAQRGTHLALALRDAASSVLRNPLPWGIALGALWGASGLQMPGPAMQVIRMLGDAATPVALFTIGAVVWRAGQAQAEAASAPSGWHTVWPVVAMKLLLHPLAVGATGWALLRAGVGIPPLGLTVLVLAAALPSASNVSMLAERYGADNGRIARIVLVTTALAFVSFSMLAAWLGVAAVPR